MPDVLTLAAVLSLAGQCAPGIDANLIAGIAKHESGFNPSITHVNTNGSIDYGLMQINDRNFGMLGLTKETALDPCRSIAAAQKLFQYISTYNTGSSWRGLAPCAGPQSPAGCGYTVSTLASIQQVKGMPITPVSAPPPKPAAPPLGLQDQLVSFTSHATSFTYR